MKYLLFVVFFVTTIFGFSNTIRKIESINYRAQGGEIIASIKLSDGSIWIWTPDTFSSNLLRSWKEGDEVTISTSNHPGYVLYNLSKPRYQPTVSLSFQSYTLFPYITNISPDRTIIELNDGSSWRLLYEFNLRTTYHWSRGDRMITTKGTRQNYELINLDIPFENRLSIERSIQVEKLPPKT